jgi:hypothetical protein
MSGHSDHPGWRREHTVDHADYLDALLDPDDPLHAVAVAGQGSGNSELVGIARTLLIKEPWASLILDGKKTWELRRSGTGVRGAVGITPSGSGQVAGQAELVDVHGPFTPEELSPYRNKHQVDDALVKAYDTGNGLYAWEFRDAHRYDTPIPYDHPQGAVIWVKLA